MRATLMYGAGDVRVETVPDAQLIEPTDALVRITRACICGSDLWPYRKMQPKETGRRMVVARFVWSDGTSIPLATETFFDNITIGGGPAPVRA